MALYYLREVHVTVGQMLRLVVVVSRVCNACVILLHGLMLREGRLLRLQLRVHHVAAHQGLRPARHGLCTETQRGLTLVMDSSCWYTVTEIFPNYY